MVRELRQSLLFSLVTMLLFGGGYHAALWAIGRAAFPAQAGGSLIYGEDGTVVGSSLIAQKFTRPEYFHPRPSAVDYDAASTGGSNWGPSNPEHLAAVRERLAAIRTMDDVSPEQVPSEMITSSGAGLDPHIPPEAATLQAPRLAAARNVSVERLQAIVAQHTETPTLGFLGRARVNVLELNLSLDEQLGTKKAQP